MALPKEKNKKKEIDNKNICKTNEEDDNKDSYGKIELNNDYVLIDKEEYVLQYAIPYWYYHKACVDKKWENLTLTKVFEKKFNHIPIDAIKKWVKQNKVKINGHVVNDVNEKLHLNDQIEIEQHKHEPPIILHKHLSYPNIIFEDDNFIVVNKPATVTIHSTNLYSKNTIMFMLQNGYYHQFANKKNNKINNNNNNNQKYYVFHRLDRLTSGLLILAKNYETSKRIASLFKNHQIVKHYLALVHGKFDADKHNVVKTKIKNRKPKKDANNNENENKTINNDEEENVNDLESETHFELKWYNEKKNISCVLCKPVSGKQHQIRIHLTSIGYPIVNDIIYSKKEIRNFQSFEFDINTVCDASKKHKDCVICENIENWKDNLPKDAFSQRIYLHALKYTCDEFSFETEIPSWANNPS